MHEQFWQIIDKKIQKDQKAKLPLLKPWEQKQGVRNKKRGLHMLPAVNTTRGGVVGKTLKSHI